MKKNVFHLNINYVNIVLESIIKILIPMAFFIGTVFYVYLNNVSNVDVATPYSNIVLSTAKSKDNKGIDSAIKNINDPESSAHKLMDEVIQRDKSRLKIQTNFYMKLITIFYFSIIIIFIIDLIVKIKLFKNKESNKSI
ncbi:hypothetical protein M2S00_07275 [Apilactobacillus sp. TMW 2.2459]|uniref:hypothetical protein n=1 Tax=Apilactobacillus xinyiensis TaxID=2841032 RepID=UPI00200C0499|nr:hypothetical protein [Apilactobacillus xinyiensis]MCL0312907.1 hypothetical protein [Apilactobacillus xinyiensis]